MNSLYILTRAFAKSGYVSNAYLHTSTGLMRGYTETLADSEMCLRVGECDTLIPGSCGISQYSFNSSHTVENV